MDTEGIVKARTRRAGETGTSKLYSVEVEIQWKLKMFWRGVLVVTWQWNASGKKAEMKLRLWWTGKQRRVMHDRQNKNMGK